MNQAADFSAQKTFTGLEVTDQAGLLFSLMGKADSEALDQLRIFANMVQEQQGVIGAIAAQGELEIPSNGDFIEKLCAMRDAVLGRGQTVS